MYGCKLYFVKKKFIHINFWILVFFLLIGQTLYRLNTTDLQLAVGCLGQLDTSQGATKHWTTGWPSGHCPAVGGKMKKIVLRGGKTQWYLVSWSSEEILTMFNCWFNQLTSSFFFVISRFTTGSTPQNMQLAKILHLKMCLKSYWIYSCA